jgi:hypothetical protein
MLKYTISGTDKLHTRLAAMPQRVHEVLTTGMNKFLEQIKGKLIRKMSGELLKKRTGTLVNSVTVAQARDEGNRIHGSVYIPESSGPALYARVHEGGAVNPWVIMSVKARALRFVMDGKVRFAKSVMHPPLPARRMFGSTEAESAQEFRERMKAAIEEALRG